jgi:hypothetical protein
MEGWRIPGIAWNNDYYTGACPPLFYGVDRLLRLKKPYNKSGRHERFFENIPAADG